MKLSVKCRTNGGTSSIHDGILKDLHQFTMKVFECFAIIISSLKALLYFGEANGISDSIWIVWNTKSLWINRLKKDPSIRVHLNAIQERLRLGIERTL